MDRWILWALKLTCPETDFVTLAMALALRSCHLYFCLQKVFSLSYRDQAIDTEKATDTGLVQSVRELELAATQVFP